MHNQTFSQTFRLVLWGIAFICLLLFTVALANAQLPSTVDEGSISITYNDVAGQRGYGGLLTLPFGTGNINGHAAAIGQKAGPNNRIKYHAEIGTSLNNWDFNIYTNGLIKNEGRVSGVGIAVEVPEKEVGSFHITAGVGVEGANAGQIGAPSAWDLVEGKVDNSYEDQLTAIPTIRTGLTIDQRNAFRGKIYGELSHASGFTLAIQGLPEILSDNDIPIHQLILSVSTNIEAQPNVRIVVGFDVGLQTYDDTIEREFATLVAVELPF